METQNKKTMPGKDNTSISIEETNSFFPRRIVDPKGFQVGFDWPDIRECEKLMESDGIPTGPPERILRGRKRTGDLLSFRNVVGSWPLLNPEQALEKTYKSSSPLHTWKCHSEKRESLKQSKLIEMDQLWRREKKSEKGQIG